MLLGSSLACLPNLLGGGGGGGGSGCCPPGPSCHQASQCSGSYVSPPSSGPASYAVPLPSYAQPPPQYAQPAVPVAPQSKYPTAGK
ncbi:unnamed protein product [Caenorhabditis sp. 36 PRJEB53466]|nr:unnamed protein product [Caenorhabditis sp. 36 PRJEB53466]